MRATYDSARALRRAASSGKAARRKEKASQKRNSAFIGEKWSNVEFDPEPAVAVKGRAKAEHANRHHKFLDLNAACFASRGKGRIDFRIGDDFS
jgi:hypothetical protein